MHAVENDNVVESSDLKADHESNKTEASSSYTSVLNSAINSTKRRSRNSSNNRFFYTVGNNNFLFEKELKVENLASTIINKVPHTPKWCKGIISVRGVIMPVMDMRTLVNNEQKNKPKEDVQKRKSKIYLLMIEHKNHAPIILQIDKLPEMVNIKDYTYSRSANNSPNWQGKTWKNSSNKLFEVDHDKLFNSIKN
jgi:chemotaxis signal transduction protein